MHAKLGEALDGAKTMDTKQLPQAASRESQMRTTLANLAEEDARLRLPIRIK
jgi:hypothetical protein